MTMDNNIWEKLKHILNENPYNLTLNEIIEKIPITHNIFTNKCMLLDYTYILHKAGFVRIIHGFTYSLEEKYFTTIYKLIWKIPEKLTIQETKELTSQPEWMLWFMYPEGNII